MTQPAKVQEPSMEEILSSIRRIIADDEAKPAGCRKAAERARSRETGRDEGPAAVAAAKPVPKPSRGRRAEASAGRRRRPQPAPAASNNQDDIDAMLASLDAATPESDIRPAQPEPRCVRPHRRDGVAGSGPGRLVVHKIEPQDDIEFTESAAAKALHRQPAFEPPPFESAAAFRRSRSCRVPPYRRSNPPSTRWPIPCSATMRGRWKTW